MQQDTDTEPQSESRNTRIQFVPLCLTITHIDQMTHTEALA